VNTRSANRTDRSVRGAFTLVELLVVIAIMTVMISAVITGGAVLLTRSRVKSTEATLSVVQQAIQQFHRDAPSITKARQRLGTSVAPVKYADRYGGYPPDELEVFTNFGLLGQNGTNPLTLAPGGAVMIPKPDDASSEYPTMRFFPPRDTPANELPFEHRDLAAMILAIELYSPVGSEILDSIPGKFRSEGPIDPSSGLPCQFLDRNNDSKWDAGDYQIRYILDDWGLPLVYYSQRDFDPLASPPVVSTNHAGWKQASTGMIRLNGSQPIIMSYGPNGEEQLGALYQQDNPLALLHADWVDGEAIDDAMNDDNVYVDEALIEKLRKGDLQ